MKNKIRRYAIALVISVVMLLSLGGCNNTGNSNDDSVDMQFVSEMVEKSKNYADSLFKEYLSVEDKSEYEIKHSNYGFISYDPLVFMVGYEYVVDDSQYLYGYKMILNEDLSFTVIEEGETTARFILNNNSIDHEIMVNDKKINLDKKLWESNQIIEIDKNVNNIYELILPEGASIYRWKSGKINPKYEERFQYIFDDDLEGLSLYAQKYIFELADNVNEFEVKLINIDDVDKSYEQVDGKIFKFSIK